MNNEELGDLEMIFNKILATAKDAQGLLKTVEQAKTDTKQFILSREEKQKQRMKERLENDSVRNAKASGDYERGYDHGFDDCKKLALLEE